MLRDIYYIHRILQVGFFYFTLWPSWASELRYLVWIWWLTGWVMHTEDTPIFKTATWCLWSLFMALKTYLHLLSDVAWLKQMGSNSAIIIHKTFPLWMEIHSKEKKIKTENPFYLKFRCCLDSFRLFFLKCHFKQWVYLSLETINFWTCEEMYAGRLHLFCWKALTVQQLNCNRKIIT